MRKARSTEHQIIAVLKSVVAGRTVKDICFEPESQRPVTTSGKQNMVAWRPATQEDQELGR